MKLYAALKFVLMRILGYPGSLCTKFYVICKCVPRFPPSFDVDIVLFLIFILLLIIQIPVPTTFIPRSSALAAPIEK